MTKFVKRYGVELTVHDPDSDFPIELVDRQGYNLKPGDVLTVKLDERGYLDVQLDQDQGGESVQDGPGLFDDLPWAGTISETGTSREPVEDFTGETDLGSFEDEDGGVAWS